MSIKQYDVWYIDLGEPLGSEQGGIRPCVILQNNVGNYYAPTTIAVPITKSKKNNLPTHFDVKCDFVEGVFLGEQMRCVDKERLLRKLGNVAHLSCDINKCLTVALGI